MKAFFLSLIGTLALSPFASARSFKEFPESLQRLLLETAASMGMGEKPIAELPDSLKPPEAGLVLLADYEHAGDGKIPVYLINRSGDTVWLQAQDRDVYLKLEFQAADGTWKRAQPHQFSSCGNSYGSGPPVRNDHFLQFSGYQPFGGQKAKIRFHLYRQMFEVTSNVGEGLVNPREAEAAQKDDLTVLGSDFDTLAAIAQGTLPPPPEKLDSARKLAIWELGGRGFKRERVKEVLNAIVSAGEEPFAKSARQQLSEIDRRPER